MDTPDGRSPRGLITASDLPQAAALLADIEFCVCDHKKEFWCLGQNARQYRPMFLFLQAGAASFNSQVAVDAMTPGFVGRVGAVGADGVWEEVSGAGQSVGGGEWGGAGCGRR